ncbi:MAG: alpha/beta hydrolase [Pseudomonadota bacterium]
MGMRERLARTVLKLPDSWLVKLAGGTPLVVRGHTLDARFQFLSHMSDKRPTAPELGAVGFRAAAQKGLAMIAAAPEPGVSWRDFSIKSQNGDVPVRLYTPDDQSPDAPLLTYFHMGGGVIGDLETCHVFCTILASDVRCPVLSVDYRLAPEHKWPAGLNDCRAAYEWALKNAGAHGAPPGEAAVGGDSMGGHFAAIIAQETKRDGLPTPALQLLIYPATNLADPSASHADIPQVHPLTSGLMNWFAEQYLPDGADPAQLLISPALATDMEDLCPAVIATAGFDPLADDGKAYADRLTQNGVDVDFVCYQTLAHGFTAYTSVVPAADKACREIARKVSRAYAGRISN